MPPRRRSPAPHPLPPSGTSAAPPWLEALYDAVPDTVFFIKDGTGRYTAANQTLAARLGLRDRRALIGKTAEEVFPGVLGQRYAAQDLSVLQSGPAARTAGVSPGRRLSVMMRAASRALPACRETCRRGR